MTALSVYDETDGRTPTTVTTGVQAIQRILSGVGVDFERQSVNATITGTETPERILSEYASCLANMKRMYGYTAADVIKMEPEHAERVAIRQRFLNEHIHAEDEARLFVAGRGAFYLHIGRRVLAIICEGGDFLRVPAGTRHWFDMGPLPHLIAIRMFTNPEGWIAQFTGSEIALRFPLLEPGGLSLG